jgi:signal transduction histidine kinase
MTTMSNEEAQRLWARMEDLSNATLRVTSEHELDPLLTRIADASRELAGARFAALGVLNGAGDGKLSNFVTSGLSPEQVQEIGTPPSGAGVLGLLPWGPDAVRMPDVTQHPKSAGFPAGHPPMRSFLGVPIIGRNDTPIGNLYLTEKIGSEEFSKEDEILAVMFASHAAVAVENAKLMTEQQELLENVRSIQQARDRFFAMVNHELRNAITAVYGWAELWLRKAGEDAPRAALETHESAQRAVNLLEDLLDLSRVDASKLTLHLDRVDATKIVAESIGAVEPDARKRNITLEVSGGDRRLPCQTDPLRVRQILVNLLRNAVRHSPDGSVVTLGISRDPGRLRFEVVDRGHGIDAAHLGTIFDAWERATSETQRGTGLGLTLSRQLARLLGGDLRAESPPGQGARFILDLPLEQAS